MTEGSEVLFLRGERIDLRPVEVEDLPSIRRWANDPEIRALTGEVLPISGAGADEFLERVRSDRERVWLAIVLRETGRVIGEAGLLRIFHPGAPPTCRLSSASAPRGGRVTAPRPSVCCLTMPLVA